MRLALFVGLSVLVFGVQAEGLAARPVMKWPSWRVLDPYEPRAPKSLADVPEPVRTLLVAHLTDRLGADLFSRLELSGGQVIDLDELHRLDPRAIGGRREVPTFHLNFDLHMPEVGIDLYTAEIELRKDGTVVREIDLPKVSQNPGKLRLVPRMAALQIARKRGFTASNVETEITYDAGADALVWKFSQKVFDDGLVVVDKHIEICAHNGKVLRQYKTNGIR